MEVGDRDLLNPNVMRDEMHDWVVANENMAKVLAAQGYHYQFVFARNAGHGDRAVKQQTLPEALEYLWQGYKASVRRTDRRKWNPGSDASHRLPLGADRTIEVERFQHASHRGSEQRAPRHRVPAG